MFACGALSHSQMAMFTGMSTSLQWVSGEGGATLQQFLDGRPIGVSACSPPAGDSTVMKSIEQIRRLRNDLLIAMDMPCKCDRRGHIEACARGRVQMSVVASHLSWVLGENDAAQSMIDEMRRDVAEFLSGPAQG